jgi:hypothetical protein
VITDGNIVICFRNDHFYFRTDTRNQKFKIHP